MHRFRCRSSRVEEIELLKWLFDLIADLRKNRFTGYLKINFFKGGITNVNKDESLKPPKEEIKK
jgi:hypothetical protein